MIETSANVKYGRTVLTTQDNLARERQLRYFNIAADISRATSSESLQRACVAATSELGYDFYLFGGYYPAIEGIVMSSSFPDVWRQHYDANGYIAIDPTVRHCWSEATPIKWGDITYSEGKLGEQEFGMMEEAAEYGLVSGISVPMHGAGAEGCMLSLAARAEVEQVESEDDAGLHLVVHAMHETTKKILARTTATTPAVAGSESLSPREIECLSWTARGKTSWEISRILELSENTVIFHLRNAIKKLEVTNRSHAVAKAIALSKITPF